MQKEDSSDQVNVCADVVAGFAGLHLLDVAVAELAIDFGALLLIIALSAKCGAELVLHSVQHAGDCNGNGVGKRHVRRCCGVRSGYFGSEGDKKG